MTRYLLDTNHASALLDERPRIVSQLSQHSNDPLWLCTPSLGELWYMVFNSGRAEANRSRMERLLATLPVQEYQQVSAREFGAIRVELRRKGRPIPPIDTQMAAIARSGGFTLLTADAHFGNVDNLTVENWLQ